MNTLSIYPHCKLNTFIEANRAAFFDKMGVVKREKRYSGFDILRFDHLETLRLSSGIVLLLFHNYDEIIPEAKKITEILYHPAAISQYLVFPDLRLAKKFLEAKSEHS